MATTAVVVLLLVAAASYGVVSAQMLAGAPGPSASNDCMTALLNVSDCLTYVEDGSKLAKPDKGCCPELAGLVDSNPICLCQLLGNPNASPVKIDYNRALKLPSVCGVTTPPVSTCSAMGIPVSSPPSSDSLSPTSASATSPSPSDAAAAAASPGSQPPSGADEATTTPSSPLNKNNGALSIKASLQLLIFGFAITAFASIF